MPAAIEFVDIQRFRGIDSHSDDADIQTADLLVNLIPTPDGLLETRPPIGIAKDLSIPTFPADAGKVFHFCEFDGRIFIFSQKGVYFSEDNQWKYVSPFETKQSKEILESLGAVGTTSYFGSYFPFNFSGEFVSEATVPVIFDSHILFSVTLQIEASEKYPIQPMTLSFALYKALDPNVYRIRPAQHTYLNDLAKTLSVQNTKALSSNFSYQERPYAIILDNSYQYIDIETKIILQKTVTSKPVEFVSRVPQVASNLDIKLSLQSILLEYGKDNYHIYLNALYSLYLTLNPGMTLYIVQNPTDKNTQPFNLTIPVSNTRTSAYSFATLPLDIASDFFIESAGYLYGLGEKDLDLIIANPSQDIVGLMSTGLGPLTTRFPGSTDTVKMPRNYADYSTSGFFVRNFGTTYVTFSDLLFLSVGAYLYYAVDKRYDFFDPLKRLQLDGDLCDLQTIQQTYLIITTKSISRVDGEIGINPVSLTKIADIGIKSGSKTFTFNDRLYLIGTDAKAYSVNRFAADPSFGFVLNGSVSRFLTEIYNPISLPEYNAFGFVFSNSYALCFRYDIGVFFVFKFPPLANSSSLVTVLDKQYFSVQGDSTITYYKIGGESSDAIDDEEYIYRSPTIYPAALSRRAGRAVANDICSIVSVELTDKSSTEISATIRSDLAETSKDLVFRPGRSSRKCSAQYYRAKEIRLELAGKVNSNRTSIRRIRINYMTHNETGYSTNEY